MPPLPLQSHETMIVENSSTRSNPASPDSSNHKSAVAQKAGQAARHAVRRLSLPTPSIAKDVQQQEQDPFSDLDDIRLEDLSVGKPLGHGEFCDVHEVQLRRQTLALKRLRRDTMEKSPQDFVMGAVDLASEATLLTGLHHPNIIEIQGIAAGPVEDSVASEDGFFFVMERLETTLTDRAAEWKEQQVSSQKGSSIFVAASPSRKELLVDRLDAALQLARAIQHLHSQGIVHRDLKPDNIGFDEDGVLKVFDFGLATKMVPSRVDAKKYRKLHGTVGTPCYMAPEMALRYPYNQSVDVYMFGLLLWEICALDKAFEGYNERRHMTRVVQKGERPRIFMWWPRWVQSLIKSCWSPEPSERPSMMEVVATMESKLHVNS